MTYSLVCDKCFLKNKTFQRNYMLMSLCLWFRASLIYINNYPTRCKTNQSIYYSARSLYIFRVLTTLSLATLEGGSCTKNMTSTGGCSYSFVFSWWWVWLTPETCKLNLQHNKWTALCSISLDNYWYSSYLYLSCNLFNKSLTSSENTVSN
jgi:hypothetical protein